MRAMVNVMGWLFCRAPSLLKRSGAGLSRVAGWKGAWREGPGKRG